jgi:methylase of polypeptide subunit release factors
MSAYPVAHWKESGKSRSARWRSENGLPPPKRVIPADDRMSADAAYHIACQGTTLLWRGDFQNARQLLQALARRVDRNASESGNPPKTTAKTPASPQEAFHLYRMANAQRSRTLGMLILPFEADHRVLLPRAPDVRQACEQVYGAGDVPYLASLRELLGVIGAYEWRKRGVEVPALGARIHPHYGVFSPVRSEYVELVASAPLPALCSAARIALDIGTGTGVLAAVLARRGLAHVVATDHDPRALACARENISRLGLEPQVRIEQADLFPDGRAAAQAALIVCNPPWIPGRPSSPLESSIYDQDSRMLLGFLAGLAAHLEPRGEGWLILSDFAELLGLRTHDWLLAAIAKAGLQVLGRIDVRPRHPRASDKSDRFHEARRAELISLWRLGRSV